LRLLVDELAEDQEVSPEEAQELRTALASFSHLAGIEDRVEVAARLRLVLGPGALDADPELAEDLHARGRDQEIWTGE
jgi:hypothetical protein